jgi:hypothetical protein
MNFETEVLSQYDDIGFSTPKKSVRALKLILEHFTYLYILASYTQGIF